MQREEMAGENLREGTVEVAFEQWTERQREGCTVRRRIRRKRLIGCTSRLQRFSHVTGKRYRNVRADFGKNCRRLIPVSAECREFSLNLGGNTDERFALSISVLGAFSFCRMNRRAADRSGQERRLRGVLKRRR
mgnify:CR=1 FL=1